ncbi:uncharacterized protein A1O9_10243 [Exophiala aquamarina CBS 119918]|uniref:DUF7707 domain-containing protein n=1 Tax=Exophiala aquamarina CBS 119918 TaxID=1182545 RepID=A0A072P1Z0_9EURO|nr:uncharacterized protein A1O9_10243 [Exophiala aquamarina CBS 119918]KEF53841.1 hypothetical protein A1O9_10243 [Exophiala aquamarina CBS 119918]
MLSRSLFAAAALAVVSYAQTIATSSASSVAAATTVSQVMPPAATASFNPAGVDSTEAFNWCRGQLNTCPQICGGSASQNRCDSIQFTYTCVCANGTVPDCTAFSETLPYFICQATYGQCVDAHPNDAQGQSVCEENQQCGTRNATAEALAATSAAASSSAAETSSSASSSASGSATAASSSTPSASSTGNAAVGSSQQLATGAFTALLIAACKFLL